MMFMMPHTRLKPRATTARIPPASIPLTRSWRKGPKRGLAFRPDGRRIFRLRNCYARGPNSHELSVLDLVDHHRLEDIQTARIELQQTVERHDVEVCERVADLLRI